MLRSFLAPLAMLVAVAIPVSAIAHPRLLAANPAQNATVARPVKLSLQFSENLVAPLSGVELTMTGMPGMADHPPMAVTGVATTISQRVMTVTLSRPLPRGTYELKWHVVAADQHRISGSYSFSVS